MCISIQSIWYATIPLDVCMTLTHTIIVNPVGLENLQWRFYFVYIAILIVECLSIWFLFVETKGPTLEEIATLFDGDQAEVGAGMSLEEKVISVRMEHIENS